MRQRAPCAPSLASSAALTHYPFPARREAASGCTLPRALLEAMCGSAAAAAGAGPAASSRTPSELGHCLNALSALMELPGVGAGIALALLASFRGRSLADMAAASAVNLRAAIPGLSSRRAALLRQAFIRQ